MRIGRIGFVVGHVAVFGAVIAKDWLSALAPMGLEPGTTETLLGLACVIGSGCLVAWRAHDFNETFWNLFWIDQVPFVGQFWSLWLLLSTPGTEGMNSYGHPFPI